VCRPTSTRATGLANEPEGLEQDVHALLLFVSAHVDDVLGLGDRDRLVGEGTDALDVAGVVDGDHSLGFDGVVLEFLLYTLRDTDHALALQVDDIPVAAAVIAPEPELG
jgi:hypothetical protein